MLARRLRQFPRWHPAPGGYNPRVKSHSDPALPLGASLPAPTARINATEPREKDQPVRGPLLQPSGTSHGRLWPSRDLAPFVEHYWWARWDLPEPQTSEVLSYPSVHVVFEGAEARLLGVVRAKFTRPLVGSGEVFAIKFLPGMFRPWYRASVASLTDREVVLRDELGTPGSLLAAELLPLASPLERARALEAHLRKATPRLDPQAVLARALVERARSDAELRSATALAQLAGLTPRALQRLFREYVGVGPKWVVRRFRLQEAAALLESGSASVASIAAALAYFDQAHFVRDFKSVVGSTPSEYLRRARERARGFSEPG